MTPQKIDALTEEVKAALNYTSDLAAEVQFLRRVLRQAGMTHRGELRVDPAFGPAAVVSTAELEICAGGVRLIETPNPADK